MILRHLINSLRWLLPILGVALAAAGALLASGAWAWLLVLKGLALLAIGLVLLYGYTRSNRAEISPALKIETWDVVNDEQHSSNTDLLHWNGAFYLVHAAAPFHFASQACRLILLRSSDARSWSRLAEFGGSAGVENGIHDIRDPKLAVINGRLFLYALQNVTFNPEPYTTVYTVSDDGGQAWSPLQFLQPEGWLFWRPRSRDGVTWYAPAYWREHGKAALFRSSDGIQWEMVSTIYDADRCDETDIEFLPDGRLLATARLEFSDSIFGHPQGCTLVAVSEPPYTRWTPAAHSPVTRLDGPALFTWNERVYAVGRRQPDIAGPFRWQGSAFSRKRTALFLVLKEGLIHLSDLPSCGDTAYAGVAIQGGSLYISYYTNDPARDYPWIVGMLNPTRITLARLDLRRLETLATHLASAKAH